MSNGAIGTTGKGYRMVTGDKPPVPATVTEEEIEKAYQAATSGPAATPTRKRGEPWAALEEITPERAMELLAKNGANRRISEPWVKSLARDIVQRRWQIDGNAIRIADSGRLLDGQHRLSAIIQAKKPVRTFVIYGLKEEVMHNIDRGRPRTLGDLLKINRGIKASGLVSGIIGQLAVFDFGVEAIHGKLKITYSDAEAILNEYQEHIDWAVKAIGMKIEPGIPSGGGAMLAAFIFVRSIPRCKERVTDFADRFKTGRRLRSSGDPAEALRTMCARMMNDGGTDRRNNAVKTLRALEAELNKEPLSLLKVDSNVVARMVKVKEEAIARHGRS